MRNKIYFLTFDPQDKISCLAVYNTKQDKRKLLYKSEEIGIVSSLRVTKDAVYWIHENAGNASLMRYDIGGEKASDTEVALERQNIEEIKYGIWKDTPCRFLKTACKYGTKRTQAGERLQMVLQSRKIYGRKKNGCRIRIL